MRKGLPPPLRDLGADHLWTSVGARRHAGVGGVALSLATEKACIANASMCMHGEVHQTEQSQSEDSPAPPPHGRCSPEAFGQRRIGPPRRQNVWLHIVLASRAIPFGSTVSYNPCRNSHVAGSGRKHASNALRGAPNAFFVRSRSLGAKRQHSAARPNAHPRRR